MPPSPAMRCSPGREPRGDNHKRGRSLESVIPLKQIDDDLALFNEVQSRERDNFLLEASDDFEDIFASKLRYFSDYKLGINVPARGESSDLLHAEEEKNDYEWLLTPPDTPLFPSLDDEVPQVNVAQRGRPRTQPISISRSSTIKSHRSSRGSASPNRVSLSPRSHNSAFESRGVRAMSAPSASPPTVLKPATSPLRSSPPSRKPVTPVPRASTPPSRRLSTGSNNSTPGSRGSRGNSPSPKVKAWQSTIPGFSSEAPPNLRTSLADRPASYVRGSSPASRNSRQSMSPTASRSISSSHSKGSVGSSNDDDMESFSSVVVSGGTQRLNSRRVGGLQYNHKKTPHQQFSKKPSSMVSSSSAPKRSFDLALRQMDHRKGPQNMFRPLLSSVPSSSFHAGISSSPHNTMITRNSSVTNSNASSGHVLGGVHESETGPDDVTSEPVKIQDPDVSDEVFLMEKDDGGLNESCDPTTLTTGLTFDGIGDIDIQVGLLICSKCGCKFSPIGLEDNINLCGECRESYSPLTVVDPVTESATTVDSQVAVAVVKSRSSQHDVAVKDGQSTYGEPIWNFLAQTPLSRSRSEESETKQVNHDTVDSSNSKVDSLEGAGISLLLKRSNSIKGTVVRNMTFSASSISYDDFSYVRDSTNNSMRSLSVSSSTDFSGVNRQPGARLQRELSSTKSEIETYKFDLNNTKSGSSLSATSSHACHNEENDTFTPENNNGDDFETGPTQTHVDSAESLLTDCSKVEKAAEFQEIEGSGSDDTRVSETCTLEDRTDVDKAQPDTISGESDQAGRVSPGLKCDGSLSSTNSIEESQEVVSDQDRDTADDTSNIIEESVVVVKHKGETRGRSLTLEEATDTILFCSSIVHDLAHTAATIAIEKESRLAPVDDNGSWPLIPATRKSDIGKPEFQTQTTTKRPSKSQRSRQKKEAESDMTKSPNSTEHQGQTGQPKTRIIGVRESNNGESKKPPMLESKCNCRIM
ncbi:hypothetical protein HanLR1_Chr17g0686631 [Helianthus annuus]|nr:hypothetical protein HanLR1_Chr17g0686631 [Helianthus annuus]